MKVYIILYSTDIRKDSIIKMICNFTLSLTRRGIPNKIGNKWINSTKGNLYSVRFCIEYNPLSNMFDYYLPGLLNNIGLFIDYGITLEYYIT